MRHFNIGKVITGILMIFIFSCILPSCATTSVSQSEIGSRKSLMMQKDSNLHKGLKTRTAKASRDYKKSKKKNNMYKKSKHKYKKRRGKSRTRRRR